MKLTSRVAAGLAAVLMATTLAACGSSDDATPQVDLDLADPELRAMLPEDVREEGVLTVASDVPYPPFEFYDSDGKTVIGLDPGLGKAIGDLLGIRLDFKAVNFDTMIPSMLSGKYDIAFTGMGDTPERQEKVDFVNYLTSGGSFMVLDGADVAPTALPELCGLTVGAQSATVIVEYLSQLVAPECPADAPLELSTFTGQDDLVTALRSDRVDVAVIPTPSAVYLVETTGEEFELPFTLPVGLTGIAFPKGEDELVAAFQAALQRLMDDGTYLEILDEYGLADSAIEEATVNAGTS